MSLILTQTYIRREKERKTREREREERDRGSEKLERRRQAKNICTFLLLDYKDT